MPLSSTAGYTVAVFMPHFVAHSTYTSMGLTLMNTCRFFFAMCVMAICLTLPLHAQLSWKIFGNLREGRADCQVVCIGNGQALVIGGYNATGSPVPSCELLDVYQQTITDAAPMNVARAEFVALLAPDSSVIAVSGDMTGDPNSGVLTPTVERYDRATGKWSLIGSLKIARYQHVAGFISDHEIVVVGGRHANLSSMADAEIFDITTGTSTTVASYPFVISTPVMGISSTGAILVFAGRDGGTNGYRERNVYRYIRSSNSWIKEGTIADPIQLPEILKLWDGRLAIAGGSRRESPLDFTRDVQIENGGTWSTMARMQSERQWFAMEQWTADTIMTLGGYDNSNTSLNSMDWINITTGASTPGPLLNYQHQHCRAVSIPFSFDASGRPRSATILVVSGRMNGGKITPAVEVLDNPCTDVASAGEDRSICRGDSIGLTATGGPVVHWSPSEGLSCVDCANPVATPETTTTYTAIVSSSPGCSAVDSVKITVLDPPTLYIGGDTAICFGESLPLQISDNGVAWRWTPAEGLSCTDCRTPVSSPVTTTTYHLTVTGANGCSITDSITVTVAGVEADAGISQTICKGDSVELQASDAGSWKWAPADGLSCTDCRSPMASPAGTTLYTVTVNGGGGCPTTDTVSVTVLPPPTLIMGTDTAICFGNSARLQEFDNGVAWKWSPAEGLGCSDCRTPVASPATTTTYHLTVTAANGCSVTDSITVTVVGTGIDAGVSQTICIGDSAQLQAGDAASWIWTPADGLSCTDCPSPLASPSTTTLYTVEAITVGGCRATDTVSVTVIAPTVISARGDTTICISETTELHANGAVSYQWSPADGLSCTDCPDPIASPDTTTTYTVVGRGIGGCTAEDQVTVTVEGTRVPAHIERGYHLLPGATAPVRVILDEPLGAGIDQLYFTLNYEREMLRLGGISTTATQLEGWNKTTLIDTIGGISLMFTPPPGGSRINGGVLLWLDLQGYIGDSTISELPFTVRVPNQHCVGIAASPGRIEMDSICGLSYRLIERDFSVLKPVTPNPTHTDATIEFELGLDGPVRLEVVDAAGEQVAVLVDGYIKAGSYSIQWNSGELSSALYYLRLIAGGWMQTQRVMLEK
jgi:hypothetical protein